jgi:hypothetical protein
MRWSWRRNVTYEKIKVYVLGHIGMEVGNLYTAQIK